LSPGTDGSGRRLPGLPESFVHPDPARSNIIATPAGLVLVDWTGAGRGARVASLAVLLNSVEPRHIDDVPGGYRPHVNLTVEELDRLEGVLWIRPLWLACWQCWLAVVSQMCTGRSCPTANPSKPSRPEPGHRFAPSSRSLPGLRLK
jgi:thiamine kinase-like enzyme